MAISIGKSYATYITVAKDGTGNYTTVQAAIDNAPVAASAAAADTIYIKDGKYKEKIVVPATKPYIVMIGQSVANTILTYDDGAITVVNGAPLGTQNSASFTISATDFTALNITFANSYGDGTQAVAVLVNNDRAVFKNCRFLGNQDTLYIKGNGTPKHFFAKCYIDGNVDFIFGSSVAVFDTCVIYGKVKPSITSTYMVAPNTTTGQTYGIIFRGCQLTGNTSSGYYYLGRPWNLNPKAVYLDSKIYNNMIIPAGWSSNSAGTATIADSYFGEHKSRLGDGTLVDTTQRITGSYQLTDATANTYTLANIFGSWDPCALVGCGSLTPSIAMANMKATKGATTSTINWNISWPITGVQYQLYRSSDSIVWNPVAGSVITAANDTTWNFQFTDNNPAQGSIYWYYVKATKAGYATNNSDTVKISSAPTIIASSTMAAFTQYLGTPSTAQTYTVSGTNLTANVAVAAPTNYQVSTDGITYTSTVSLAPASGTLAASTVYVRLNAASLGAYSGNIVHTSTGAITVNVPVTGNTIPLPVVNNDTLEYWPLTVNNADSAGVRAVGVVPTTPTLSKLFLSTATSVTTIPAYSATYGEAFGASSTTDGGWGTAAGGPGGNLNRTFYQEFTIKAASGDSLRIDSLILASAFYNTSSSTKLAVVYSKTGFVSDSTEVTGATFASPILLANQTAGPSNVYRLAMTGGPVGVKTDTAGTLTIRLYFCCSSSTAGRYGMLKGVTLIGEALPYVAGCVAPALSTTVTNKTCAANGSINLTTTGGSAPFTYVWTGPGTYTANTQNISNLDTGNYTVVVTATGGCTATTLAHVSGTTFTAAITPQGATTVCQGDTVRLKATTGTGFTYVWKNGTTVIVGATDSVYKATATGSYTVTVTNGTCSAVAPAVAVTVNPRPVVTVTVVGLLTLCSGDSVKLKAVSVSGNTYQWRQTGTAITGATDSSYVVHNAGSYTVKITNAAGCKDSSTASVVTVNTRPVAMITALGALTFCFGDSVKLKTTGVTGYTYQWKQNGTAISGASDSAYVVHNSGSYTVRVANAGCADSSAATVVTVNPRPVITVTASGPLSFCGADSVQLKAVGATGNTYQWRESGTAITGATDSTYVAHNSGSYTVKIVNAAGCSDSSLASVVAATPLPVPVVVYAGGQLSTGTYNTYQWNLGGVAIGSANSSTYVPLVDGSYSVTVDSGGCSATSAAVNVTGVSVPSVLVNGKPVIIYPNPVHDIVYVKAAAAVTLTLKDVQGRVLKTDLNATSINIGDLSAGIYFLSVSTADGEVVLTQRVVKAD